MEISELKIFLTVARQGSISKAAERLHCVQSNVTTRLKQMEERLGSPLFHRSRKGVTLTPSGQLLLGYAERILRLVKEAEEAVADREEPMGRLTVGSMETTAAVRLPPLLAAYHRTYPRVELNLVTGPSEESLRRLLDYEIDAALVAGEIAHQGLAAEKAFEEELVLVAPPETEGVDRTGEWKVLVFRSGCSYRARMEGWLRETGKIPYRTLEFGSIEGILGCVAVGMGISCLPRSVMERRTYGERVSLHPLPARFASMTTWLVRRRDERPSAALTAFRDLIVSK